VAGKVVRGVPQPNGVLTGVGGGVGGEGMAGGVSAWPPSALRRHGGRIVGGMAAGPALGCIGTGPWRVHLDPSSWLPSQAL
jgi:hypothetical protein